MITEKDGEYIYKNLTYKIIGAVYNVHRELGIVHKEIIYHRALATEFTEKKIPFAEEKPINVKYKGKKIGIYKNGKQWRVRWFGQYDPKIGRQKRYSKTFARKKDAERFKKQKEKDLDQGAARDISGETLADYGQQWLRNKAGAQGLRPATIELYGLTLGRLYKHFGEDCLLRKIDRREAQAFLAKRPLAL